MKIAARPDGERGGSAFTQEVVLGAKPPFRIGSMSRFRPTETLRWQWCLARCGLSSRFRNTHRRCRTSCYRRPGNDSRRGNWCHSAPGGRAGARRRLARSGPNRSACRETRATLASHSSPSGDGATSTGRTDDARPERDTSAPHVRASTNTAPGTGVPFAAQCRTKPSMSKDT